MGSQLSRRSAGGGVTRTAYLSGLGVMGRRHLRALVRAGFSVTATDPNVAARDAATKELVQAGLPASALTVTASPNGEFELAVFAETAPHRLDNYRRFLERGRAHRVLLEKPLSADPAALDAFVTSARDHQQLTATEVNLGRRAWPHVRQLAELCARESHFAMSVTGGAVGLGSIGIHLLDTFLMLSGDSFPDVIWSAVSEGTIKSGRGPQFRDYGAEFVLRSARGTLLASLDAASSANVTMVVRGEHFVAQMDYTDVTWKLSRRRLDSQLPNYRYGADYEVVEHGPLAILQMEELAEMWARGEVRLPTVEQACHVHRLLAIILAAGGAPAPYAFT